MVLSRTVIQCIYLITPHSVSLNLLYHRVSMLDHFTLQPGVGADQLWAWWFFRHDQVAISNTPYICSKIQRLPTTVTLPAFYCSQAVWNAAIYLKYYKRNHDLHLILEPHMPHWNGRFQTFVWFLSLSIIIVSHKLFAAFVLISFKSACYQHKDQCDI